MSLHLAVPTLLFQPTPRDRIRAKRVFGQICGPRIVLVAPGHKPAMPLVRPAPLPFFSSSVRFRSALLVPLSLPHALLTPHGSPLFGEQSFVDEFQGEVLCGRGLGVSIASSSLGRWVKIVAILFWRIAW